MATTLSSLPRAAFDPDSGGSDAEKDDIGYRSFLRKSGELQRVTIFAKMRKAVAAQMRKLTMHYDSRCTFVNRRTGRCPYNKVNGFLLCSRHKYDEKRKAQKQRRNSQLEQCRTADDTATRKSRSCGVPEPDPALIPSADFPAELLAASSSSSSPTTSSSASSHASLLPTSAVAPTAAAPSSSSSSAPVTTLTGEQPNHADKGKQKVPDPPAVDLELEARRRQFAEEERQRQEAEQAKDLVILQSRSQKRAKQIADASRTDDENLSDPELLTLKGMGIFDDMELG